MSAGGGMNANAQEDCVPGTADASGERAGSTTRGDGSCVGSRPLEPMAFADTSGDDPRLIGALETYLEARRNGRPLSRDEFLSDHAEIAERLAACLSGLEFIETAGLGVASGAPLGREGGEPLAAPARLGDYEIIREIGRGGMGMVYEARQISLGRRVALKVLPFASAVDPTRRQRFQIEAQAAAQLHHPHIVPIFAIGCDQGLHYYAMQYIEGQSLAALLKPIWRGGNGAPGGERSRSDDGSAPTELDLGPPFSATIDGGAGVANWNLKVPDFQGDSIELEKPAEPLGEAYRGPLSAVLGRSTGVLVRDVGYFRDCARLGAEAATALDHAHSLGVLHRDIKPANLLLDVHGTLWVTDFGLARCAGEASLTRTGDLVGTLRYMSPEQSLARRGVVDQRTDIYALGATLYELLALQPAFDGADHQELLRLIALEEPLPPRRIDPAVPRDLETIVLKAMAKEPSSRYATARELADDLGRFVEDRPIKARPPGTIERTLRWGRRRRELVATAAAVFFSAIIVGSGLIYTFARRTAAEARKTEIMRLALNDHLNRTFALVDSVMTQSMKALAERDVPGREREARGAAETLFLQAISFYKRASELPMADRDSRLIVGRAFQRLGFGQGTMSLTTGQNAIPDLEMLRAAQEHFRRSLEVFESLSAEFPTDPDIQRHYADVLGSRGMGWLLQAAGRGPSAEPHYRRAIDIWRSLVVDQRANGELASVEQDFRRLADEVNLLAEMLEEAGSHDKAVEVRRQLAGDARELAGHFPSLNCRGLPSSE